MTREEAKNWLRKLYIMTDITDEYGDMIDMQPFEETVNMAIKALEQAPKTGKWIERHEPFTWMGYTDWVCSVCGKETNRRTHFCPNCGADMRGAK